MQEKTEVSDTTCELCSLILAEARQSKPIPPPGTVLGYCCICGKDVVYPNVMTRWRRARLQPVPGLAAFPVGQSKEKELVGKSDSDEWRMD